MDPAKDAERTLRGESCGTCKHRCPMYDGGSERQYLSCGLKQEEVQPDEWCEQWSKLSFERQVYLGTPSTRAS